jgi:hypothetical protein
MFVFKVFIPSVTKSWGQTLDPSSTYQKKKKEKLSIWTCVRKYLKFEL